MNDAESGQINTSAAEVYEAFFVPALFAEWPPHLIRAAGLQPGDNVLDVACGTGVLARAAADEVGYQGSVTGLDINPGMLAVARQRAPHIAWQEGSAEALPFDDAQFNAVLSQFALMFFSDRARALQEMIRVLRPGGHLVIAVWDEVENIPGYLAMTTLLQRLFGSEAADALHAPFNLGNKKELAQLFAQAGLAGATITTIAGQAQFPSISSWVYTDIKGWTLADMISDEQFEELSAAAEVDLRQFINNAGQVSFPAPAHLVSVLKPNT
jgi:ubiquinone/menaquinone biosynthesis C-methylase UbiE